MALIDLICLLCAEIGRPGEIEQIRNASVGTDAIGSFAAGPPAAAGSPARSDAHRAVDAAAIRPVCPRTSHLRTTTPAQFAQTGNNARHLTFGIIIIMLLNLLNGNLMETANPPDGLDSGG